MADTTTASGPTGEDLRRFGLLGRPGLAVIRRPRRTAVAWLLVILGGVILGVAVLLDAFLVRLVLLLVLLPVLLRLTGRSAWACPRWLRRTLPAIRFSH